MHCGFEPTAVNDTFAHPIKALRVMLRGPRTDGPFARDLAEDGPFDEPEKLKIITASAPKRDEKLVSAGSRRND